MVKGNARELILDNAEALFADQGVDAVSLRAINAAAGVSPGVLHYHFGRREALIEALIERRMHDLMEQRKTLLTALLDQPTPSVKAIINALVQPLADFVLSGGDSGKRYIRFMARIYNERSEVFDQVSKRYIDDTTRHIPRLIKKTCPHLSTTTISLRLASANHAMLNTLADLSRPQRHWQQHEPVSPPEVVEQLKCFLAGGLSAAE